MIGPGRPFCVIGERINPTGRKKFQAQLQQGDLSRIEIDVAQQTPLADMLDVNVGDPLADEVELMRQAVPLVQSLTELPLVIDSSVIEARQKGLAERAAILPSICLVRSPSALRFIDERVPGISVPEDVIERCERAADPESECFNVACELADAARALPGVRGLHLISFRKEAGIARLCARLGIPTREERETIGNGSRVAV